jgi:hypothetical protein
MRLNRSVPTIVSPIAMKTLPILAISSLLLVSTGVAGASPLDFLFGQPRHEDRHDHRHDDRYDHRGPSRRPMSTSARAQLRLRELGYYRGPIDGDFGRGSRYALSRFQRDRGLRPTGALDERTLRALRI